MSDTEQNEEQDNSENDNTHNLSSQYVWRKSLEAAVQNTAISNSHHCAACVVDESLRILSHSDQFSLTAHMGFVGEIDLTRRKPKLFLREQQNQAMLVGLFQHVIDGEQSGLSHLFKGDGWVCRLVISELKPVDNSKYTLPRIKRQFIIRMVNILLPTKVRPYLTAIQDIFSLTPAEVNLCAELLELKTLPQAAEQLGIKVSTARTQIKGVFEKVAVNSQTALVARLTAIIIRYECTGPM